MGLFATLVLGQLAVLADEVPKSTTNSEPETSSTSSQTSKDSSTTSSSSSSSGSTSSSSSSISSSSEKKSDEDKDKGKPKEEESKAEKEKQAGIEKKENDDKEPDFTVSVNYTTQEFIKKIGEDARTLGQENDIYASVMIAQAILESGSGNSGLAQPPHHNLFGIKGAYQGSSVTMSTQEDDGTGKFHTIKDAFRSYPDYRASLKDYVDLIRTATYQAVWKKNAPNYKAATKALTGLYATDKNYNKKLDALIEAYDLTKYDQPTDKTLLERYPDGDYPDYDGKDYPGAENYTDTSARYAFNRMSQLGGKLETNFAEPKNWSSSASQQGYEVKKEVKVGTVVSLQPGQEKAGSQGQVAVVEKVFPSGAVLISEYGKFSPRLVSFRVIDAKSAQQLEYITPKSQHITD
ncbi:autolysin, N-acetylmuramidase-like protein [Streptococcus massiliensis]|uniref:Autolysin, N-acetylmuramidase-like protein n=2 Tax=Streptococcus massiliensis TaxID=313439 RepID=A0A380KWT4_9STRE|nr:autolysin, N-acetylmuramidase-like protein [Streptococcus massiliensis]